MADRVVVDRFRADDTAECLRVFASNVPAFLAAGERPRFEAFLAKLPGAFWVARHAGDPGSVVGCGGVSIADDGRTAWLRWGLVDAALHRRGIGTLLLMTRLR
jgi:hypothetical protein